jgi:transcriptional regulator with XRE-family HTH domain
MGSAKELNFLMIGERIRRQREFMCYTRENLAEMLSVSVNFCRDIEIGAKGMSIQTLARLADALRVSSDYILFGAEPGHDAQPLLVMLAACRPDKLKYAEDMLRAFLLAVE